MDILKKHWRITAVAGFGLSYLVFWLMARNILDAGVDIREDQREEKEVEDIRDVDVDLVVENGSARQTLSAKLTTNETVFDLLEEFREIGLFTYEQLEYTYGVEITSVNGRTAPMGYQWNVYDSSTLISDFRDHKLSDNSVYYIKLEPISP